MQCLVAGWARLLSPRRVCKPAGRELPYQAEWHKQLIFWLDGSLKNQQIIINVLSKARHVNMEKKKEKNNFVQRFLSGFNFCERKQKRKM